VVRTWDIGPFGSRCPKAKKKEKRKKEEEEQQKEKGRRRSGIRNDRIVEALRFIDALMPHFSGSSSLHILALLYIVQDPAF
jgi:hypothetical protein